MWQDFQRDRELGKRVGEEYIYMHREAKDNVGFGNGVKL